MSVECDSLKEAYNRLEADIQAKELVDSICVKDYSETIKKLNDKLNLVTISEGNVLRVQDWNKKYNELNAKYEEAQRKLSERDKNVKATLDRWYAKYIYKTSRLETKLAISEDMRFNLENDSN